MGVPVPTYSLTKTEDGKWALITIAVPNPDNMTVSLFATPIRLMGEQHLEMVERLVEDANRGANGS